MIFYKTINFQFKKLEKLEKLEIFLVLTFGVIESRSRSLQDWTIFLQKRNVMLVLSRTALPKMNA